MSRPAGSSPHFTPRTAGLLAAARSEIRDGDTVVDLGAGRRAEIARALLPDFPTARFVAVEPLVPVQAPPRVKVVAGEIDLLPERSADVILFNPPNTPERFLDPGDGSYHQFYGGPDGTQVLHGAIAASLPRLRPGGRMIFICPTFTCLPEALWSRVELMWQGREPLAEFLPRVPVRRGMERGYRDFLDRRIRRLAARWEGVGVRHRSDAITAVVLLLRRTGDRAPRSGPAAAAAR